MITSPVMRADYVGSGTTGPFSFPFRIFTTADLEVTKESTAGVLTSLAYPDDFTVIGVPSGADAYGGGGSITLAVALASGELLAIRRVVSPTQPFSFQNAGPYFPKNHEDAFDRLTMAMETQQDDINRSVKQSVTTHGHPLVFPPAVNTNLIGWDANGDLKNYDNDFRQAIVQDFSNGVGFTSGVTTQLTLSGGAPGTAANVLIAFDGVVQDHTKWSLAGSVITFSVAIVATKVEVQWRRTIDVGTTVIVSTSEVNVKDPPFNAQGDGIADDTAAIQAAIDSVAAIIPAGLGGHATGGGDVIVPAGTYIVDSLVLKYGVRVIGAGQNATFFKAKSGSTAKAPWLLNEGVVAYSALRNCKVQGNGNTGQHGIYFQAQPIVQIGVTQGGWWRSALENVAVTGFDGEGIWLHGGGDSFQGPHQFLTFDQVEVDTLTITKHALRISGEVNQVRMLGPCRFDGPSRGAGGTCVLIERTVNSSGANNGNVAALSIDFGLSSIQSNTRGVTVETGLGVSFIGTHFEELYEGIYVDLSGDVHVKDAYAGNVGKNGGGTGFFLKVNSGSAAAADCRFAQSSPTDKADFHYVRTNATGILSLHGNHVDTTGIRTTNVAFQVNAAGTVDITGHPLTFVNTSATAITTVTDNYAVAGDVRVIKAHNGPITLQSGGNLYFDAVPDRFESPWVVARDTFLVLVRMDIGTEKWAILAGSENANYHRKFGCNGAVPQASATVASPATDLPTVITLANDIRTALITNGIAV